MAHRPVINGATGEFATWPPGRDLIAENLRALFRNAESEPLPQPLRELLDRLAREENS